MKRWKAGVTILAAVMVLAGSLGAYAISGADDTASPAESADPGGTIEATTGGTFEITLDSNPTTGYVWVARYDETAVELVDRTFEPASDLIGAGGQETLVFKALAAGETRITMACERPWEQDPIETKSFDVTIRG